MLKGKPICTELKQIVVSAVLKGMTMIMVTTSRQFLLPKYSVSKIIPLFDEKGDAEKVPKTLLIKTLLQLGCINE